MSVHVQASASCTGKMRAHSGSSYDSTFFELPMTGSDLEVQDVVKLILLGPGGHFGQSVHPSLFS